MSQQALTTWFFGKIPSLGDFVSRGVDLAMRDRLDHWLSQEMELARAAAGDEFEARYDAAPAWNFVDCDEAGQWNGGAMCASQDRAGRRFPLIMAAQADNAASAAALSGGCLTAMCNAFAGGYDADALAASAVQPEDAGWQPSVPQWALLAEDGPAVILQGRFPQGAITKMVEMAQ